MATHTDRGETVVKALVLTAYHRFEIQDFPQPEPAEEEVLIAVKACGICGSDVHGMDGSTGRRQPPIVMGHEASGLVVSTGSRVDRFVPGDRVTFDSTVYCGHCFYCRSGRINLCDARRVLGVSCDEYRCHGAFAEYVTVPQHILYRIPEEVSFEHAAMVEPVSVAAHAVGITPVRMDDTAVVMGAGMIGLLLIQALRIAGCGCIIAVDIDPGRLELAGALGAGVLVKADEEDLSSTVAKSTEGRGADLAFEAVGTSETVHTAIQCVRKGASVTLVGNLSPRVDLPLQSVVTREITLRGSCASAGEYPACLNMMGRGQIDVTPLLSAVTPLEEGPAWFRRLYNKEAGLMKVILTPGK
jgi:L-iditol 2-dehydrogenase